MKAGGCRFRPKNSTARSKINRLALPNFGSSPEADLSYMALRSELALSAPARTARPSRARRRSSSSTATLWGRRGTSAKRRNIHYQTVRSRDRNAAETFAAPGKVCARQRGGVCLDRQRDDDGPHARRET